MTASALSVVALSLVVSPACGRVGFDPLDGSSGGDGTPAVDGASSAGADAAGDAHAELAACGGVVPRAGFLAGASIAGQGGWNVSAAFDEDIAIVGGAHGGAQAWRVSNRIVQDSFTNQPMAPGLAETAGESTVRSAGGGDSMEIVAWVRSVSGAPDGSSITFHHSPPDGERMSYVRILNDLDGAGGLQIVVYDYLGGGSGRQLVAATDLPRQTWMELHMAMQAVEGPDNDVVDVFRDGALLGRYSSWEGYFRQVPPIPPVNRPMVRLNIAPSTVRATFPDADALGFYIDDLCHRVYDAASPATTIDAYATGFE